eukprot:TRINITY_DN372_c0_g1_i3.p1 TRINITY_DN372_c0_g1~~TRINITY_DN372_c0_g1_i3.p1  ORF type:complete len:251 (-),score=37.08 TRINITY_DN372_c0_g1_i3:66-818(-)
MQHLPPPQIDIGPLLSASDDRAVQQVHAEIADACKNWGFFNIVNHGVDPELVSKFEEMTRHFFSLPKEVKNSVRRTVTNSRGYFDDEYTQQKIDWKEGFDFGDTDNEVDGSSVWPEGEEEFKSVMLKYFATMKKLSEVILGTLKREREAERILLSISHLSIFSFSFYFLSRVEYLPWQEARLLFEDYFLLALVTRPFFLPSLTLRWSGPTTRCIEAFLWRRTHKFLALESIPTLSYIRQRPWCFTSQRCR